MPQDYGEFVDNYKTFILEPDVLAVTHVAPINSSRLSVSLLAP